MLLRIIVTIFPGEAVIALIQEVAELLRQSEVDGFSQNLSFQAELTARGE